MRVVQIENGAERRVALVEEPHLRCLVGVNSVYELAQLALKTNSALTALVQQHATGEALLYEEIYEARSGWRLLWPIDVPDAPQRVLVSGTGLTHLGSAKDRQNMHLKTAPDPGQPMTDSMRMFEWGLAEGRPEEGKIGIAPEWFYKGNGGVIRKPSEALTVPAFGEEAEIAGVYVIDVNGAPARIGFCAGNEFADHKFERRNYLNLAGSKLRDCSLGPELVIDADFHDVQGQVSIERDGHTIWSKIIESGDANMAHSLGNLEHHHFKFVGHRRAGDAHVHFFGAHSLSFGEGLELRDGDWMQVHFEGYGRPLRNPLRIEDRGMDKLIRVRALA